MVTLKHEAVNLPRTVVKDAFSQLNSELLQMGN
ncbi:hypothetical protein HD842_001026 [Massilia aurea]|uniref:Uncharacterized protein n=1 Tax=Massilia aurea TaxID=373040 RepID=A0A7W9WY12_9BURK|nr:hypothetical protein [Massilia aurea]